MAGPLSMKIAQSPRRLRAGRVWLGRLPRLIGATLHPAGSAVKVSRVGDVSVMFSQAMLASTITSTNFTLKAGATSITGTVTYESTTNVARFRPAKPLAKATVYTAQLTTAVQTLGGTPITLLKWTFTTRNQLPLKWFPGLT
jgi:Bacterial Ig-like domain